MKPYEPTPNDFKERLDYDPETGLFTWSQSPKNPRMAGKKAGSVASNGYVMIQVFGKRHLAHRIAWFMTHGQWPSFYIDHVNRIKHDNRIANLRDVPQRANVWNQPDKDVLVGARRLPDGTWASVHMEFGEEIVQTGFLTSEEANNAFLTAQKKVRSPFGQRPKVRPINQRC